MSTKLMPIIFLIAVLFLSGQSLATAARAPAAATTVVQPGIGTDASLQTESVGAEKAISPAANVVPTVVGHSPTGTNVSTKGTLIAITFSVKMSKVSAQTALSVSPAVPGSFSWSGDTMRYKASTSLAAGTTYTVTEGPEARSSAGIGLAAAYSWTFTTAGVVLQSTLISCAGDSITEGLYPAALQKLLGSSYQVGNFGAGGTTVIINNGGVAVPYITTAICQQAQQFMPQTVVLMLGTNDSDMDVFKQISRFVADYEKLVGQFQAVASHPRIFLVKPSAIYGTPYNLSNTNLVNGVIPRITQVASAMGVPTIDVYSATTGHPEYFVDGVHPNSQGAAVIANVIYQAIK